MEVTAEKSLHCCAFCYRVFKLNQGVNVDNSRWESLFLQMLKCYLKRNTTDSYLVKWVNLFVGAINSSEGEGVTNVISSCADCSGVMKSFCEHYEQMKVIEMKLEWRLRTLMNIIESSEKVKPRRKLFHEKLEKSISIGHSHFSIGGLGNSDIMKHIKSFRTELVKICTERLTDSFPKVTLRRCDDKSKNKKAEKSKKRPHGDDDHADDCNPKIKVPRLDHDPDQRHDSDEQLRLLNEVLNEPGVKVEPSTPKRLKGNDSEFEIVGEGEGEIHSVVDLESETNSMMGSPSGSMTTQDLDYDDDNDNCDFDTTVVIAASIARDSQGTATAIEFPSPALESVETENYHETSCEDPPFLDSTVIVNSESQKTDYTWSSISNEVNHLDLESKEATGIASASPPTISISGETEVITGRRVSLRQRYQCTTCSKNFLSEKTLQEHMKTCATQKEGDLEFESDDAGQLSDFDLEEEEEETVSSDAEEGEREDSKLAASGKNEEKSENLKIDEVRPSVKTDKSKSVTRVICDANRCTKWFGSRTEMEKHILKDHQHDIKRPCSFCNKSMKRNELIFHQNQVHLEIKLETETVDVNSNSLTVHEPDKVFKCAISTCPETFMNKQNLETHAQLHGSFQCQFCDVSETYAPDLAIHEASSHNILQKQPRKQRNKPETQMFSCPRCDFAEYTEKHYLQHFLRQHLHLTFVVSHTCCICKSTFPNNPNGKKRLVKHYNVHHDLSESESKPQPHSCNIGDCNAYFLREEPLTFHKFIFHGEKSTKFPCPDCDKVLSSKYQVHKHGIRMHKSLYKIPCPHEHEGCRMRFKDEENVSKHLALFHRKAEGNPCPQCGDTFAKKAGLEKHLRFVHAPKKPKPPAKVYLCTKCGKNFKERRRLDMHELNVHIGPDGWQFSCDICGKKCVSQNKLDEHKRVHTQEKPFKCEECGLSYAHRHNYRHHLKNKHGLDMEDARKNRSKTS